MLGKITQNQYEQMRQQLIVPLAISDILLHELPVEPDMQYGLHMALSEVDPDSALLAIALCLQDLAKYTKHKVPIASALEKEANDILEHYAPMWLRHNINAPISPDSYATALETVPEDLEAMADLLDALRADVDNQESNISTLASLLSIQARAHMEIADFILAEIAYEQQSDAQKTNKPNFGYARHMEEPQGTKPSFAGDNVIVFPGTS